MLNCEHWNIGRVPYAKTLEITEWLKSKKVDVAEFNKRVPIRSKRVNRPGYKLEFRDTPIVPGYLFFRTDDCDLIRSHGLIRPLVNANSDYIQISDDDLKGLREEAQALAVKHEEQVNPKPKISVGKRLKTLGVISEVKQLVNAFQGAGLMVEMEMFGAKRMVSVSPQTALELSEVAA